MVSERIEPKDGVPSSVDEAIGQLPPGELARLKYSFDQGMAAFVKLKCGLFLGVHMDQLSHMESVIAEGKWSVCRKLIDEK